MVVDHVEVERVLAGGRLADVLDGLGDGGVLVHGDEVARHEAAGGVLGILEELLDLLGLLLLHEVEDLVGLLLGQLLDHLDDVVGRHLVEDARDLVLVEGADQLQQRLVVQLGQHGARPGWAAAGGRRAPLGNGQLAQRAADVGGVGVLQDLGEALLAAAAEQLLDRLGEAGRLLHGATRGRRAGRPRTVTRSSGPPRPRRSGRRAARQSRSWITALAIERWPPAPPRSPKASCTTSPAART